MSCHHHGIKILQGVRLLAIIVIGMGLCTGAVAQSEPESTRGSVELQSQKDTVHIPVGTKIAVKYTTDPRTFPDLVLEDATDSALVIGGDTIGVEYFERISIRNSSMYKAGKITLILSVAVVAALGICLALIFLFAGNVVVMVLLGILLILLWIPGIAAFPAGLIVGAVLLLVSNKSYALGYRWRIHAKSGKSQNPIE